MEQHPFDVYARVSAKAASEMEIETWSPPTISDGGHMVYAETRAAVKPPPERSESELTRKQAYDEGVKSDFSTYMTLTQNSDCIVTLTTSY